MSYKEESMATFEITIDEEQIEAISQGDGVAGIFSTALFD